MSSILDLSDGWEFLFDSANEGIEGRWYAGAPEKLTPVQIPHLWERDCEKSEGSVAFYFRTFELDSSENAKRIFLRFKSVSFHTTVWLNGKMIGENTGSHASFDMDISKAVKLGEENILCLRVAGLDSFGRINGISASEYSVGEAWSRTPYHGILDQTLLILGGRACITRLNVVPDLDQEKATLEMKFNNPRNYQAKMRIVCTSPSGKVGEIYKDCKLERENATFKLPLTFKEPDIWAPDTPNTYKIEVYLDKSYGVEQTFGFRKFDCLRGDFYLNDQITKLQGIIYSQHDPDTGYFSMDAKKVREDLQKMRDLGVRVIRSGGTPLNKIALDICDEIGMMVFQDLPIFTQKSSKKGLEEAKVLIEALIEDQKTHPCIVAWVLGAENGTLMLENGTKLLKNVDQCDHTRPVFSNLNCVYIDHEQNFKKDTGKLMGVTNDKILLYPSHRLHLKMNTSTEMSRFLSVYNDRDAEDVEVPDMTFGDQDFQDDYDSFVYSNKGKFMVTLKNHIVFPEMDSMVKARKKVTNRKPDKVLNSFKKELDSLLSSSETKDVWASPEDFYAEANELSRQAKLDQINSIQSNATLSCMFLDEWSDYSTNFYGITDEFRNSKGNEDFVKEICTHTRILVSALCRSAFTGAEIPFQLTLLNHDRLADIELVLSVLDGKGKEVSSVKHKAEGRTSHTKLGDYSVKAPENKGEYTLQVTLKANGQIVHSAKESLLILDEVNDPKKSICFLDEADSTADALKLLSGDQEVIITSNVSVWSESVLAKLAEVAKTGRTVILAEMDEESVDSINQTEAFELNLKGHFSTGASSASYHYMLNNKVFKAMGKRKMVDSIGADVCPSYSLDPIEGAEIHARSLTLGEESLIQGVDLQVLPYGSGKLVFNQYILMDNLESNALADHLFVGMIDTLG
jgi:hypothetical protein